jgi:hypothetical protein
MTLYLMNAIPNALMPDVGNNIKITGISENVVKDVLAHNLRTFVSAISHESTAKMIGKRLWLDGKIPCNPIDVQPKSGDIVIAALFMSSRRSALTEAEILDLPIKWVEVSF